MRYIITYNISLIPFLSCFEVYTHGTLFVLHAKGFSHQLQKAKPEKVFRLNGNNTAKWPVRVRGALVKAVI